MSEEKLNIYQKLQKVQYEMKAPKNLYNSFGKYNYRNAESIQEAFKPFGEKYGLLLVLEDKIEVYQGKEDYTSHESYKEKATDVIINSECRYYVRAIATLIDIETKETLSVSALARESIVKKGMDSSQVTGATSSYARKYALNGLFLLDDTKDADTDEYHNQTNKQQQTTTNNTKQTLTADRPELQGIHPQKSTKEQLLTRLNELLLQSAIPESYVRDKFEVEKLESLTKEQIYSTILCWNKVVAGYQKESEAK